jgi:hypothetical protein
MSATDGLPTHNLLERDSPGSTLDLMRALTEAALAARVDLLHPSDVVLASGGRPGLSVVDRREPCVTWAPEAARSGPTPATLSFSVAMLGVLGALGSVDQSPEPADEHHVWLEHLLARLEVRWAGNPGAARALDLIARSLAHDPFSRPRPRQLLEQLGPADPARTDGVRAEPARTLVPTSTGLSSSSAASSSLSELSRARAPNSLSGITVSPVPTSSQFAWVAAVIAVVALAMATCTLGTVLGKLAVSPSLNPSPRVVVQPVPIPVTAEPVAPTPAAVQVAAPDTERLPAQPVPDQPATRPARPEPRPSPRPAPAPASAAPQDRSPAPEPTPAPAPASGASNDLRDPWKN